MQQLDLYQNAIMQVLGATEAYGPRDLLGRRQRLPGGIPFQIVGGTVYGPQAATVTLNVRDEDLGKLTTRESGERLALRARSHFAYVYRHLELVRVEFTLPPDRWRVVPLAGLPQHKDALAIGQQATGAVARLDWKNPHKAVFGSTRYGKSVFLVDYNIAISKAYDPEECKVFIINPKNDEQFAPLYKLPHMGASPAIEYTDCERLLFSIKAEALERRTDKERCSQRWVIFVDEISELIDARPRVAEAIRSLAQIAGGLNINLVVASQAANPSVFGDGGSKSKVNFKTVISFALDADQAFMVTRRAGRQYPIEQLGMGGKGDCIVVSNGIITRCRAALPDKVDFANLPRIERLEPVPQIVQPVSERVLDVALPADSLDLLYGEKEQHWTIEDLGRALAYALVVSAVPEQIRTKSGVRMGTDKARAVRDVLDVMRRQRRLLKGGVA
ncbi:MAG: hypothetical protein KJ077_08265 [Anaerolineae bacterium]|nr:hypothetical protein [Anaerolineae bacterium]